MGLPEGWRDVDLGGSGHPSYRLVRWLQRDAIERFLAASRDPRAAQAQALARVLDGARGTDFARRHDLASIRTIEEYRRAVPIRAFGELADDLRRVCAGERDVLVRHSVRSLVKTSGTTGEPKLLPVTDPWAREVADAQAVWLAAMLREQPELGGGFVLASVGRAVEGHSAAGIAYGANTGRMAAAQPWLVRSRYIVPPLVAEIREVELRHYVTMRLALARDVRSWTTANPSTILALSRLVARYREELSADLRDGTLLRGPAAALDPAVRRRLWPWTFRRRVLPEDFRPGAFWRLGAINCWKGGAAPFFLERLADAVGVSVPVREVGITASEGYFAVPLHSSWTGGVAWAGGHLLELVDGDEAVSLWEAEVGREYRLVISTTAGLYRYDLDDRVRVVGSWQQAPLLVFVGKGRDVLSVTGEKVTAAQVAEAARVAVPGAIGFSVGVRMAERPVYVLCVEGEVAPGAAERFDRALRSLNVEYDAKRADRLADPELVRVEQGTYARWRERRLAAGAADGQVKDPVVLQAGDLERLLGKA